MIAYDEDDDNIFLYTINGSSPLTLKLTHKLFAGTVSDIAIAQNNLWVALDGLIYQFDGGTLTFFQKFGLCEVGTEFPN